MRDAADVRPPDLGPGCSLDAPAFCETFDAPSRERGRTGELDPARWSVGRIMPQLPTTGEHAFPIGLATLRPDRDGEAPPACRADLPERVLPDQDSVICDPNSEIQSGHLLALTAAQNYGSNSYRIRQPFDFAGRTGTVAFDAELWSSGTLHGYVGLTIAEDPSAVPSFADQENFEGAVLPRNAVEVLFFGCEAEGAAAAATARVFEEYVQSNVDGSGSCVPTRRAGLNRVSVAVAQGRIEVRATPVSDDGVSFGEPVTLLAFDADLPFSRGYVTLSVHNHATLKYTEAFSGFNDGFIDLDAWSARFDNVGFDGPVVLSRDYSAENADRSWTAEGTSGLSIGYPLTGPDAIVRVTIDGVDTAEMTRARLALSAWYLPWDDGLRAIQLGYRVNEGPWHADPLDGRLLELFDERMVQGAVEHVVPVPIEELEDGENTIELRVTGAASFDYPPAVANIDLVLDRG